MTDQITRAMQAVYAAERELASAVRAARDDGMPWAEIEAVVPRDRLNAACQWLLTDVATDLGFWPPPGSDT